MQLRPAAVALVVLCGCGGGEALMARPSPPPASLVIRHVRIFDAPRASLAAGPVDVLVEGGRIARIAETGIETGQAREIDGSGGVLLPGLVDVHTHTASSSNPPGATGLLPDVEGNLAAFLYAGVTTVLDLGNLTPAVFAERDAVASGSMLGPRVYAAGPVFTASGGHPANVLRAWLPWYLGWYVLPRATREVDDAAAARRAVAELAPQHPEILKITIDAEARGVVPCLSLETMRAIVTAGHEAGVRSIAHVGSSAEAGLAVEAGVDALAHSPWRDELTDQVISAIAARHVPVIATLAGWDIAGSPRKSRGDFLPIEREVASAELIDRLLTTAPLRDEDSVAFVAAAGAAHEARRRNVARLRAAGITVLAGSDSLNPGIIAGAGLHLELAKLVDAGMTPAEALRSATWDNARFLAGETPEFGEIAVGRRADLVLVAGDPTANIADLGRIQQVILGGVPLARAPRRAD
ncbi:MAG TPA: amidohydrolase family protein [Candidatus Limnocylindrales bacterium]|nr:amidohydrolase family protein [Candidatus Limnocylindrales bacterium]